MTRAEYLATASSVNPRGTQLPQSKLNPDLVRAIRSYDRSAGAWAAELGLHIRTIKAVRGFSTWRHVL